jgi:hypothetical protein
LVGSGLAAGGFVFNHEQNTLKVGSSAMKKEHMEHESWNAVVDNYVYIHNAFRNHLAYIRKGCESGKDMSKEFALWCKILDLHSKVEDELLIPALDARLKEHNADNGSEKLIPEDILSGKDHDKVHDLIEAISTMIKETNPQKGSLVSKLSELETALDEHLLQEELYVMPLMLKAFTTRELWALDSFIVNEKLGYCDKDTLIVITKWWFGNISIKEGILLFQNFARAGNQAPMPIEDWKKLQDTIPALKTFATEDIMS